MHTHQGRHVTDQQDVLSNVYCVVCCPAANVVVLKCKLEQVYEHGMT